MASYLVDLVLLAALVVTALKCGRVMRELRALKQAGSGYAEALEASDRSINRAAEAVMALKHEVARSAEDLALGRREAEAVAERLETLVHRADWHAGAARGAAARPQRAANPVHEATERVRASLAG